MALGKKRTRNKRAYTNGRGTPVYGWALHNAKILPDLPVEDDVYHTACDDPEPHGPHFWQATFEHKAHCGGHR